MFFYTTSCAQTVGIFQNESLSINGYTLFAPNVSKTTYLIDNCGHLVNSWESDYPPNFSAYLLEDGSLLRSARFPSNVQGGFAKGGIEKFNWEGDLIWQYDFSNSTYAQHHDIEPLPNGNILVIVFEQISIQTAIENGRNPSNTIAAIWPEKILELEPVGMNEVNVVWEWRAWDHLVQDLDSSKSNYGNISEHPEKFNVNFGNITDGDWMHFNAIAYNETLDQIAISSRTFEEIFIIDHSTTTEEAASSSGGNMGKGGDILYRWGNPFAYDRGTIEDKKFFGQHNVHWIAEGMVDEGQLMVFNNGAQRPDGIYSTIDVINPPVDSDGNYILNENEPFGPDDLSWTYGSSADPTYFFSSKISGAQRLPNGNTLICEGNSSRLFEVNYQGEKVWEYQSPIGAAGPIAQGEILGGSSIFRALRYLPDYPAFENVDMVVGEVLELDPEPNDCQIYNEPIVDVVEAVSNFSNQFFVSPNPFDNEIQIQNLNNAEVLISIFSITGARINAIQSANQRILLDTNDLNSGCYFIQILDLQENQIYISKLVKLF